jgi:hypothetical protein
LYIDGFFVFGLALTITPVPGPSSPRFPFSLISTRGITLPATLMIWAFGVSANAFSSHQLLASQSLLTPIRPAQQTVDHRFDRCVAMQHRLYSFTNRHLDPKLGC